MIDTSLQTGNCRSKALELQREFGGRIKRVRQGRFSPRHYLVRLDNGETWHFKRIVDIFPWPLKYLLFVGRYEKLPQRQGT